jgi:hypothetical protein
LKVVEDKLAPRDRDDPSQRYHIGVKLTLKRSSATNFLGDRKLQISRLKCESSILEERRELKMLCASKLSSKTPIV